MYQYTACKLAWTSAHPARPLGLPNRRLPTSARQLGHPAGIQAGHFAGPPTPHACLPARRPSTPWRPAKPTPSAKHECALDCKNYPTAHPTTFRALKLQSMSYHCRCPKGKYIKVLYIFVGLIFS